MSKAWRDSRHALPEAGREPGILLKSGYSRRFLMFTGRKLPLTLAFVVLVGLAFGASCKGFFVDPVLTSITIGPTGQNIQVGNTLQMSARGTYDDGSTKNITGSVFWSSDPDSIATISKGGLVTGVAPGAANISASLDTISSGSTPVNIVLSGVTKISINPQTQSANRGGTTTFTCNATVTGVSDPVDITTTVTWTSDDETNININSDSSPAVVTVGSATATGPHTITATYTVGTTVFTSTATLTVN